MASEAGQIATKLIGRQKRKIADAPEKKEHSGPTLYFDSEKQGRKGLSKKLKKYAAFPSINVSTAEMSAYMNSFLPSSIVFEKLEKLQSVSIERMRDTIWLSLEKNVLVYGFGHKRSLLEAIVKEYLIGEDVLFIDGINGMAGVKALLKKICLIVNGDDWSALGVVLNAKHLVDCLGIHYGSSKSEDKRRVAGVSAGQHSHSRPRLYIIVHDIGALQHREAQWALSILAESPSVCLIASLDHLNTSLLWDDEMLVRFNWIFKHTPTFKHHPIPDDFAFFHGNALITEGGRSGLLHVLASLTMKHRELFEVLCEYILRTSSKRMLRSELLEALKKKMTAKNPEELRNLLKEFLDHDVIQEVSVNKKDYLGVELPESELRNFMTKKAEGYFA